MADTSLAERVSKLRQRRNAPLILELDLTEGITEEPPADPLSALLTHRRIRLPEVIDGLRRAQADERVKALVAKLGGHRIGLAKAQELRAAIAEFGKAGKVTVAWAETFGEFSPGNVPYYLATAFDRIWVQPSGDVGLTGIALESFFYRGMLDKLGVDYELGKRHEYKSAANAFTERSFDAPQREMQQRIAAAITRQLADAIADRRGIDPAEVRKLIDRGPFLAAEAASAGLVDNLGYRDDVYAQVRKEIGPEAQLQYVSRYQRSRALARSARNLPNPRERFIALIHVNGPLRSGRSARGPFTAGASGSDTVTAALRAATRDDRVRGIVLRVNSPGGSYIASDTIWRQVARARAAAKPVVVSMGDLAASGGYFVSVAADVLVAQPGTLTGSIGVFGGKAVLGDLLTRAGVTADSVAEGERARMFSSLQPFTETEWDRVNSWLDHIYADFTGKVAEGRMLSEAQVDEIARGRVWTGAEAADNGLVDEIGGLDLAERIARRRAGLPAGAPVRLYPRPNPMDRLRPQESSEDRSAAALPALGPLPGALAAGAAAAGWALAASQLAESWGPVAQVAARMGLPAGGPLLLTGDWTIR
jgi:protease-4